MAGHRRAQPARWQPGAGGGAKAVAGSRRYEVAAELGADGRLTVSKRPHAPLGETGEAAAHAAPGARGTAEVIIAALAPTEAHFHGKVERPAIGFVVAVWLGLALSLAAGLKSNSWRDTLCMFVAVGGVSLPSFWIGMVLIYVFGMRLGWVPIVGSGLAAPILPSITVGLFIAGSFARLVRASVIEAMGQDYIRTARAKGQCCARPPTACSSASARSPT